MDLDYKTELRDAVLDRLDIPGAAADDHDIPGLVDQVIRCHQDQYPGAWQVWSVSARADELAAMIQLGIDRNDFGAPSAFELRGLASDLCRVWNSGHGAGWYRLGYLHGMLALADDDAPNDLTDEIRFLIDHEIHYSE